MEHSKELKHALLGARSVLEEKTRIDGAIADLERQLPAAYTELRETRAVSGQCQADQALGRESPIEAARTRFTRATENLATLADGIVVLRGRLDSQESALSTAAAAIEPLLPEFDQQAAAAFSPEWDAVAAVWSKMLGHRDGLQVALNRRLDLKEPLASSVEVDPALAKPHLVLQELRRALGIIRQARTMAQRSGGRTPLPFDENAVYVFVRDAANINSRSYKVGEQVLGRLLGPAAFKFLNDTRQLKRVDEQMAAAAS